MPSLNGFEFCVVSPHLWWEKFWLSPLKHARCHQPETVEQWELLWWPLQFFVMRVTKRQRMKSKIAKDIEEKIRGKLRNSMYEENMKKSKTFENGVYIYLLKRLPKSSANVERQPMWKDVSPRTLLCETLKAHLPDRFINRLKKECIKDDDNFLLVQ